MESNGEVKKSPPVKPPRSLHTTLSGSGVSQFSYPKPDAVQGVQVGDVFLRLRFHENLYCLQSLKGNRAALVAKRNRKVLVIVDQFNGDSLHTEEFGEVIGRLSYAESKGILCVQGTTRIFLFDTRNFRVIDRIGPFDPDYNYDVTIGELGSLYGVAAANGRLVIWRFQLSESQLGWVKMGSVAIPSVTGDCQLWSSGMPVTETSETVKVAVNIRTDQVPYMVVSIDCKVDSESGLFGATHQSVEWNEGGPRHLGKLANGRLVALDTSGQLLMIADPQWREWDQKVNIHPTGLLQFTADSTGLHFFR